MVRLMKVKTNASTMFVAYDAEEESLWILDNEYTNSEEADLRVVEDWTSWDLFECIEDPEEFLGISYQDSTSPSIIDEIECPCDMKLEQEEQEQGLEM